MSDNTFYQSDDQKYKFIGSNININPIVQQFFSKDTVDYISYQITKLTKGVHEHNRDIILPDDKILFLMNTVYLSYNPRQGFDQSNTGNEYLQSLVGQTISRAVFDIKNVLGYEQSISKYTVWDTILGEENDRGLRSYAPIKLNTQNQHYLKN